MHKGSAWGVCMKLPCDRQMLGLKKAVYNCYTATNGSDVMNDGMFTSVRRVWFL